MMKTKSISMRDEAAKGQRLQRLGRIILALAAIVLLVVIGKLSYEFYRLSPSSLYRQAFIDYPIAMRKPDKQTYTHIEEAYQHQQYQSVVRLAKEKREYSDREYLLIGLAHLHLDDASAAIGPLRRVANGAHSIYQPDGEYYLALAYLQDKDYDRALELMQKISREPRHVYRDVFTKEYIDQVRLLKWR